MEQTEEKNNFYLLIKFVDLCHKSQIKIILQLHPIFGDFKAPYFI